MLALSREDFISNANACLKNAFRMTINDPMLHFRSPGLDVIHLAEIVEQEILEHESLEIAFASFFTDVVFPIIQINTHSSGTRDRMATTFFQASAAPNLLHSWRELLGLAVPNRDGLDVSNNLLQSVLNKFWLLSLQWRNNCLSSTGKTLTEAELKLTDAEEETLRYVAGYVPYSLKKKYRKIKCKTLSNAVIAFFDSWGTKLPDDHPTEELAFLNYTRRWIDIRNRGGLFQISDNVYIFIRRMENVARKTFNTDLLVSYCNENIRDVLLNEFENSSLIDVSWCNLTRSLDNKELCSKLKTEIFNKWINIRAKAFLDSWLSMQKLRAADSGKKQSISNKSEPSLRKSLPSHASSSGISETAEPSIRKTLAKKSLLS